MQLTKNQLEEMLKKAADKIIASTEELTEIDSKFGDADHGLTMTKISNTIKSTADCPENTTIKSLLGNVADRIMMINGGSAVPLWNTFFEGLKKGASDSDVISETELKQMFKMGYDDLFILSKAKIGDKTMMDTLIPAIEAIYHTDGTILDIMKAGAEAAEKGAENTKNFVAKFGRARSYKEQTIGTPDAGAVSMKYFFVGLYEGYKNLLNN
ncbi:dihydroxyacetone kinase subunit L [Oscillospiraceae bacterium PP1C4]